MAMKSKAWVDVTTFEASFASSTGDKLTIRGSVLKDLERNEPQERYCELTFCGERPVANGAVTKSRLRYSLSPEDADSIYDGLMSLRGYNNPATPSKQMRRFLYPAASGFTVTFRITPKNEKLVGLLHEGDRWDFETPELETFATAFAEVAAP